MQRRTEFFEIKSPCGHYGLCGTFKNEEEALAEINRSYKQAKERGYDNRHEKWVIVCNRVITERRDNGDFLSEKIDRFVVACTEYRESEEAFVFVY